MKDLEQYRNEFLKAIEPGIKKGHKKVVKFPLWVWAKWSEDNNLTTPEEELQQFKKELLTQNFDVWGAIAWANIHLHDVNQQTTLIYQYIASKPHFNQTRDELFRVFGELK